MNNTTINCSADIFKTPEFIGVSVASVVSAFISFTASAFVLFIIILYKKWQLLVQRLVLYLSIATLLNGLALMIHNVDYLGTDESKSKYCIVAGFFEQQAGWMQLGAMTCITVHLFLCAVINVRLEKLEPVYIVLMYFAPLLINWIPFINLAYGKAGAWCWIRDRDDNCEVFHFGIALRFILWYLPLYLILVILMIMYAVILCKLHRNRNKWVGRYDPSADRLKEQTRSEVVPLIWYPLVYFVLNIIPLINRIQNFADRDNPSLALNYLHGISYPLVGATVALLFLLNRDTRKMLKCSSLAAQFRELCSKAPDVREYHIEQSTVGGKELDDVTPLGPDSGAKYNSFNEQ